MGAGQIGGIATLLDIDFENAAGFIGTKADVHEGQYIVYYLSHAMMFCVGALIEAHVVMTPASCVFGERYKFDVYGGTHRFLEYSGVERLVQHLCIHRGYNHSSRLITCSKDNLALLLLNKQFSFHSREYGTEFMVNRVRYGAAEHRVTSRIGDTSCKYFGWGSRRNGYLIPLLIHIRRVDVVLLPPEECPLLWRGEEKFLCIQQPQCKSEHFGALCPDDVGSIIECSGYAQGMMTSRLVDRPCGVGFLDLSKYNKFLTCGVDDSREVIDHDEYMAFEFTTREVPSTIALVTPPKLFNPSREDFEEDKVEPKPHADAKEEVEMKAKVEVEKVAEEEAEEYDIF